MNPPWPLIMSKPFNASVNSAGFLAVAVPLIRSLMNLAQSGLLTMFAILLRRSLTFGPGFCGTHVVLQMTFYPNSTLCRVFLPSACLSHILETLRLADY